MGGHVGYPLGALLCRPLVVIVLHVRVTGGLGAVSARPCVLSWEHQLLDGTRSFPGAATSGLVVCECVSMQGTLTMPWLPGSEVA